MINYRIITVPYSCIRSGYLGRIVLHRRLDVTAGLVGLVTNFPQSI